MQIYTLRNRNGVELRAIDYGGRIASLKVPDRNGEFGDIVLGFDKPEDYVEHKTYFGALIGRYANRIADAQFTLDGVQYHLSRNDGRNHLHGGFKGFDKRIWNVKDLSREEKPSLEFSYLSEDGEEGYPGNLRAEVRYILTDANELQIDYQATTDQDTIVNLTNHSYFNLAGQGDILNHQLLINAESFTPVDETLIPTGELRAVAETPFDFRRPTPIGARIGEDNEQLKFGKGYDHNFVLATKGEIQNLAARVYEPTTGRVMEIYTTQPGMQFYSGNYLDGSERGKGGVKYEYRSGFCLETQHFPDSPNKPQFPSTVLKPNEIYRQRAVYKFSTA